AAVTLGASLGIAHEPAAAEYPADHSVRPPYPVFHFEGSSVVADYRAKTLGDPLTVFGYPQPARDLHRQRLVGGRQPMDPPELWRAAHRLGRHIDIPNADPRRLLGHRQQRVAILKLLLQPIDRREAVRAGFNRCGQGTPSSRARNCASVTRW